MKRELLEQEFDKALIKKRKGRSGKSLSYIAAPSVIKRLNDAFEHNWSFRIVEWKEMSGEAVVLGELTAEGITKQQFGNSTLTVKKDSGELVSIGDDLKSAASDAVKKCATLFGIGLHLYGEVEQEQPEATRQSQTDTPKQKVGNVPPEGLKELQKAVKDAEKAKLMATPGLTNTQLVDEILGHALNRDNVGELKAYLALLAAKA